MTRKIAVRVQSEIYNFALNDYFVALLIRRNHWLLTFQPRLVDF